MSFNNNSDNNNNNNNNSSTTWNPNNCIICDTPFDPILDLPQCDCFKDNNLHSPESENTPSNNYLGFPSNTFTITTTNNNNIDSYSHENDKLPIINNIDSNNELINSISNLDNTSNEEFNYDHNSHITNNINNSINNSINNINISNSHNNLLHTPIINISTLSFSDRMNNVPEASNIDYHNIVNSNNDNNNDNNNNNLNLHSFLLSQSNSNCSILSENSISSNNNSDDDLPNSINPSNLSIKKTLSNISNNSINNSNSNNFILPLSPNFSKGKFHHSRSLSGSSFSSEYSSSHSLDSFNYSKIDNKDKISITKPKPHNNSSTLNNNNNNNNNNLLSPVNSLFTKLSKEPSKNNLIIENWNNKSTEKLTITSSSNSIPEIRSRSNSISTSNLISESSISNSSLNSNNNNNNKKSKNNNSNKLIECEKCGKLFKDNGKLKSHSLTHSNIKPFKCEKDNCDKAFARRSDLRRHEKTVHSNFKDKESRRQKCGGWCQGILLKRERGNNNEIINENNFENEWYEPSIIEGKGTKWGCGDEFLRMDGLLKHWRESKIGKDCLNSLIKLFGDISLSLDEETKLNIAKDHVRSLKK